MIGGLAIAVATRLSFGTNITNLMPEGGAGSLADVSRRLTDSELARSMVLNVGAPDTATAVAGARALAEAIAGHPEVAWLRTGVDDRQMQAIYELYFPRRYYFLASDPDRIPELTSDAALRAQAERARRDLALPTASLVKRLVASDPLGSFRAILGRISGQQPALDLVDGQFVTRDGRFGVLFLGTRAPAFDGKRQKALLADLSAAFARVNQRLGGALVLERSGANVFAVATERSIRSDVNFVTAFSIVSVFVCLQLFLGSWRNLLLTGLPMLGGLVTATGLGLLVFGQLDGLTLGFGAALIGVVIDYPTHLLCHLCFSPHRARPGSGAAPDLALDRARRAHDDRELRGTRPDLLSGLPADRVLLLRRRGRRARDHALGAAAAGGAGRARAAGLARRLGPVRARGARPGARGARRWRRCRSAWSRSRAPLLPRLVWVDDMSKLWRMDPEVVQEDRRVRERVSQFETGRLVIGIAPDREQAVALGEVVQARLAPLVATGELGGIRSLHSLPVARGAAAREPGGAAGGRGAAGPGAGRLPGGGLSRRRLRRLRARARAGAAAAAPLRGSRGFRPWPTSCARCSPTSGARSPSIPTCRA